MSYSKGFSLVELSIVLVILGLLVGGIMTGQNLIHAAELRSVTSEYNQWQTATNIFRDKYQTLPGDMPNAESFWTGGVTENGDGDGRVLGGDTVSDFAEMFTLWQHLALAGLIQGEFTGIAGPDSSGGTDPLGAIAHDAEVGENSPQAKYGSAGWTMKYTDWSDGSSGSRFAYDYGNSYAFGTAGPASGATPPQGATLQSSMYTIRGALTPEDAWNIDTKMDDGRPGMGNVIGYPFETCADATTTDEYDADYDLQTTDTICALYFRGK